MEADSPKAKSLLAYARLLFTNSQDALRPLGTITLGKARLRISPLRQLARARLGISQLAQEKALEYMNCFVFQFS